MNNHSVGAVAEAPRHLPARFRLRALLIHNELVVQQSCGRCSGTGVLKLGRCCRCAGGVETLTGDIAIEAARFESEYLRRAGKHAEADRLAARLAECQREAILIQERAYLARRFQCPMCSWRGERPGECVNDGTDLVLASELSLVPYEVTA